MTDESQYICPNCEKPMGCVVECDLCNTNVCLHCIEKNWHFTDWNICLRHSTSQRLAFVLEEYSQLKADNEVIEEQLLKIMPSSKARPG